MYPILRKKELSTGIWEIVAKAPMIAETAKPGNFVILMVDEKGERVPLTIVSTDPEEGSVRMVVQEIGKSTKLIATLNEGDSFTDLVGPLGIPTHIEKKGTVVMVAGGIGIAPLIPQIRGNKAVGNHVITIMGAKTNGLYILKEEVEEISDEVIFATDDGSFGFHGFVTGALEELIKSGRKIDEVVTIGPMRMMKAVSELTKKYDIPTVVSLNAIMVDGTGMCGCCRVTVDGNVKFSCVDGPEFDAHKVNFDELIQRQSFFAGMEKESLELFKEKVGECKCHSK